MFKLHYTRGEILVIGALVLALLVPFVLHPVFPLIVDSNVVASLTFVASLMWIVGLLVCVYSGTIVCSKLWDWLPPLYFFRKVDAHYRPVLAMIFSAFQALVLLIRLLR